MDELLNSDLPWELKAVAALGIGLIVSVSLLAIPKPFLGRIGQLPFLSPNWISLWRAPLFWIGTVIYFLMSPFWGFITIVVASCLDVLDGKMAVALKELGVPRSEKSAAIGKWLDPLIDKLTLLPLLALFTIRGVVDYRIASCMIGIDIIGTMLREPINLGTRLKELSELTALGRIKIFLQRLGNRLLGQSHATAPGKIKTLTLSFSMICCAPYDLNWFKEPNIPNILVSIALGLGTISVVSRIRTIPAIENLFSRAGSLFTHEDI